MTNLEDEIWRSFIGPSKKCYLISSLGRVFNYETHRFIKPYIHKSRCGNYLRHCLGNKKFMTHVQVALHFPDLVIREHLGMTQVDHLDGNTLNPAAKNLSWKSPGLNLRAYHAGRKIRFNGINYTAKRK